MTIKITISCFSGEAADLKPRELSPEHVLEILKKSPRISTFDFSENIGLWRIVEGLKKSGRVIERKEDYPWHRFEVIDAQHPTSEGDAEVDRG